MSNVQNDPAKLTDPLGLLAFPPGPPIVIIETQPELWPLLLPAGGAAIGYGIGSIPVVRDYLAGIFEHPNRKANEECQRAAERQFDRTSYECDKLLCPAERAECHRQALRQYVQRTNYIKYPA